MNVTNNKKNGCEMISWEF